MSEEDSQEGDPSLWTGVYAITGLFILFASFSCFFFLHALLSDIKLRSNSYNLYVVFLIIPDAIYCLTIGGYYISQALQVALFPPYYVTVFAFYFYYITNFWLNGVVTYEIHKLAVQSYNRQRTAPPPFSRVYKQVSVTAIFGLMTAVWSVMPTSWALFHVTDHIEGAGQLGSPEGGLLTNGQGTMISAIFGAIPVLYVIYVRIKIGVKKLLPRKGRTRILSMFFMRVVVVFLVFYVPNIGLTTLQLKVTDLTISFWIRTIRGFIICGQALTTLYLVSKKDDIRAVIRANYNNSFGRCCCVCKEESGVVNKRRRNSQVSVYMNGMWQESGLSRSDDELNEPSDRYSSNLATSQAIGPEQAPSSGEKQEKKESSTMMEKSEWDQEDEYDDPEQMEPSPGEIKVQGNKNAVAPRNETIEMYDDSDHDNNIESGSSTKRAIVDMTGQVKDS